MSRSIFINLPVADLERATEFYRGLGFELNPVFSNDQASGIVISEQIHVMLLVPEFFASFLVNDQTPAVGSEQREVLNCLACDRRGEVDELMDAAVKHGGSVYRPVGSDAPGMFGGAFADPDGHVWELMWMDPAAAQ